MNLGITGQFDITNSTVSAGIPQVTTSLTYLRVLRGTVDFDITDDWGGINSVEVIGHQGLPILSASPSSNSPHAPRQDSRSNFAKLTGKLSRLQDLWEDEGDKLNLLLTATGQYSFSILYPTEEFRLGGTSFGRGYFNGRLSGDSGIGVSAELQFDTPIDLWSESGFPVQFYAYYDFGKIWSKVPNEPSRLTLASAGVGLRAPVLDWLQLELEIAKPLTLSTLDVIQGQAPKPPAEFFGMLTLTF
jgi:hemolysin activation/secretion protein